MLMTKGESGTCSGSSSIRSWRENDHVGVLVGSERRNEVLLKSSRSGL